MLGKKSKTEKAPTGKERRPGRIRVWWHKQKIYKENVMSRYQQQKDYFASDDVSEERKSQQSKQDDIFIKQLIKLGIGALVLIVIYKLLLH